MRSSLLGESVPDLEPGVTLLTTPKYHSAGLQQLVVSHLVDGKTRQAWWVDSANAFTTQSLYELAPGEHVLKHLQISRAFTGYQQHSLVREVLERASPRTELIIASNIAFHYRDKEVPGFIDKRLLELSAALLAQLAEACSVPVLVTACSAAEDEYTYVVRELHATETSQGISYSGEDFTTEVYWGDGYMQTTIPYWVCLVGRTDESEGEGVFESPLQGASSTTDDRLSLVTARIR